MDIIMPVLYAAVSLFIILDPILSIPVFIELTKRKSPREILRQSAIAASVAGILMYAFLFFNTAIFAVLNIDIASFQIAGGILLFILGLQLSLGFSLDEKSRHTKTAAGVVIGTPLLCGPGTITNVMLLSREYGMVVTGMAIAIASAATWLVLRFSVHINRLLGNVFIEILGRLLGMFLAAIAIRIIASGILAFA